MRGPYFFTYSHLNIDTEGPHELFATTSWVSGDESGNQVGIQNNSSNPGARFTIKRGGQGVDLVAVTANATTLNPRSGRAINVTDRTRGYPPPRGPARLVLAQWWPPIPQR